MVIELYKWLLIPVFSVSLLTNGKKQDFYPGKAPHPLHLATVEIDHNAADKTLEITCKTFWDDFESILTKLNKSRVDLTSDKATADNNKKIFEYIKSHLQITVDGKPVQMNFVGYEKEDVVIYSYLQVDNITTVNKIELVDKLMHDLFTDQTNLIHVMVGGKRKSTKLDYPETKTEVSF